MSISCRHGRWSIGIAWDSREIGQRARPLTVLGGVWLKRGRVPGAVGTEGSTGNSFWLASSMCNMGCGASSSTNIGASCTLGTTGVPSCHVHVVEGVNDLKACVGRMCGVTSGCRRNAISGAQYASGFFRHSSCDKSICRRSMRVPLFLSPHRRVVHVLCGETKELFRHSVCNVPVDVGKRG
jgi:hypothetical protein